MEELKEKGNDVFKRGEFRQALEFYTEAVELCEGMNKLCVNQGEEELKKLKETIKSNECLRKCLNNRTQCFLKLGKAEEAAEDASKILLAVPDDSKALFRRSQAYFQLDKLESALTDAKRLIQIEPKNPDAVELIQRLTKKLQDQASEQASTRNQVRIMLEYAAQNSDVEKRRTVSSLLSMCLLINS